MGTSGRSANGESQAARRGGQRLLSLAVKVIVTVGALYLASRSVNIGLLVERLARINLPFFGAAVFAVVVQVVLVAVRWQLVVMRLDRQHVPSPRVATAITFSSQFANQFMPFAGDALRALLALRAGIRARFSITSAVIDRGLGLVVLLLLTVPSLLLWRLFMPAPLLSMTMLVVALGLLGGFLSALAMGPSLIAWLPLRLQGPIDAILEDTRLVFLTPATCLRTVGLSVLVHLLSVAIVWVLSLAVATPIPPVTLLVLVPPMLFATMLPFTVSGWGAREGAVVWFLSATGTSPEGALLLSVSFGAALLVAALPGAVAWFGLVRQTN
jgi:glycosyltransferase 2 family protein